ncbi:type II toxin-antitoxin system antitoxin, RelB/DinJ family [Lactobacillus sp. CBA3605]|uniref:type II toxin-antitoxin system RelB/DinJ family antitoxin n=1 Tax=Lactobacillus sp. CBA3605 TaxID=2099788 RepID=UPI000CFBACD1|nr:type II toxin-antitoxin system RelB/DinJ family antitoxin [Lactobacillus sp. CBA3605]AVK60396.1 type II toxin-antitoxin system antitoxin, RelB/DinJ family [Lactobacillus sp. CBA3605]
MDNSKNIAISFRVNEQDKRQAALIYEALGLNLSTAFSMFLKRTIAVGGVPFDVTNSDLQHTETAALKQQLAAIRNGQLPTPDDEN